VRATFTRPVTLRPYLRGPGWLIANGNIKVGQVIMTTLQGRPIAYVTAESRTGKAQLFQSPSRCFWDS
jgi:hypothetical protein